ncbi:MAG: phosphoribosyltransferase family protein [Patescibacteria group bacterium]
MNKRIAKLLSDFGFFVFGKFYGSLGEPSPIYITSKRLYSHPDKMKVVSEEIADFMKGKSIDLVAGTMVSGTPLAMAVSLASHKPFIYLRQKTKKDGSLVTLLEGLYRKGESVLVVDDGIGTGSTKERFIKTLQKKGLVVKDVLVLYDAGVEYIPFYAKHKIKIHSFVKHNDLVKFMVKNGYISKKLGDYMYDIWKNLKEWQKDQKKWNEFVSLAKSEGFTDSNK